ncbi:MAG: hypothetical protein ACMUIG_06940 [Thermoplasmatota archaeon]
MERRSIILTCILIGSMMIGALPIISMSGVEAADGVPTRGMLGYQESLQVNFPRPVFYGDYDPHYPENDLETNTWEDVAIVIVLQDQNRETVRENHGTQSSTAQCGDVYQTLFVPLDGIEVQTGSMETIIVEDFTATWCTYCTGVIGAMNRLDLDPAWFPSKYIGVEWHSGGGTYGTGEPYDAALERRGSYQIEGGIPRYIIDGMDPWVGGSSSANQTSIDNNIRGIIDDRRDSSQIKIAATGNHDSNSAWVDFTYEVVDDSFSNTDVEAHVFLVQDAYPRRHGTNPAARLGYIGQDLWTGKIFELDMPDLLLNSPAISDAMGGDDVAEGEVEIIWVATDDEDDPADLKIDLYYTQGYDENWYVIAEDQPNTGTYSWDTTDPRIPDGTGYKIKVVVEDTDGMTSEAVLNFDFEINNPDNPGIVLLSHQTAGEVHSGKEWISWNSFDDEDMKSALVIDLFISDDGGENFQEIASTLVNSGSYELDTRLYEDGDDYIIKAAVTDTTYLGDEALSAVFTIFNNDPPEGIITNPTEGDNLMGTVEITWNSLDDEDEPEDLKVDLYYRFEGESWEPLLEGEPNAGSYSLDTADLPEGDGSYELRLVLIDPLAERSEDAFVGFTVYNPRAPRITGPSGPTASVEMSAEFIWFSEDPNPGEAANLQVWIMISEDGSDWEQVAGNMPNTGSFELDVSDLEDGDYQVKLILADMTPYNLTDEHVFLIQVDNPDAPVVSLLNPPATGQNMTGDIILSWTGDDADGDLLSYSIYYRPEGAASWISIPGALSLGANSHTWNTSALSTGRYQIMVTARDNSDHRMEGSAVSNMFLIYVPPEDTGDDDKSGDQQQNDSDGSGSDSTMMVVTIAILGSLFLIVILLMIVVVIRRRSQPAKPMPGPIPPGMPPRISGGYLPSAPSPAVGPGPQTNTLPPPVYQNPAPSPAPQPAPAPQYQQMSMGGGQYQPPVQSPGSKQDMI